MAPRSAPKMPSRWLMWWVLALCYLGVYFQRIAPGVVADRLMADFSAGGAAVGMLAAIYLYVYAVMQIPAGALADALGVRRTVTIGASLSGAGSLLFGVAPSLDLSYLGRFLVGLGVSVIFVSALKFQSNWFRSSEFGTVSGLLMVVGGLGGVVATTPMAAMAHWLGWRLSFIIIGAATLALGIAAWRWVRDHPAEPEALPPAVGSRGAPALASRDPVPDASGPTGDDGALERLPFLVGAGIVWRNRQTWAGFLAHFGLLGSYLTFYGLWATPYLMHVYGFDRLEAANHLLAASVGMLVSAPIAGRVSDRLLRRRLPIVSLGALGCVAWLAFTLWDGGRPPAWALYPLFAALGIAAGNVTLILTGVKEANLPSLSGLAMGSANNGFLCAAVLQPAIGYLLDSRWEGAMEAGARVYPAGGYQAALGVITVFAMLGLVGAFLMRETHCRNVVEHRVA